MLIFCFFLSLIFISACEERPRQVETQFENDSSLDSSSSSGKKICVKILIGTDTQQGWTRAELHPSELEAEIEKLQNRGCKIIKVNTIYSSSGDRLLKAEIWYYDKWTAEPLLGSKNTHTLWVFFLFK